MDAAMNVRLGAKTKEFNAKMKAASARMTKFGKSVGKIGRSMTMMFSMPILAAGAASVKLSLDFQKSMTKIKTLVGATDAQIATMKDGIMEMSMETAQAPVELAEGLYFLQSAGLSGANALDTLEQVAKASASGMGDMESLSIVAAAAQNAYGVETLTAAEALDKFGVMIKTGMFDAQELSNVLGKQLGLASELGISFDEVGALISTYTKTTGDATAASNGLSAVMMTFAKLESEPTLKQAEALDKIKMSAEDVKTMMGEEGLTATLQHLKTKFDENGVPMADFFTKSQALKTSLSVLGSQSETYTDTLEELSAASEEAGFVNNAFAETAETDAFKMEQAMNGLKVAGTELGDSLAPVVQMISDKIQSLTEWWTGLDEETQTNIASWLGWIAIAGPALMIIGKVVVFGGKVIKMFRIWKTAVAAAGGVQAWFNGVLIANPIGIIITLVGLVIAAFVYFSTSTSNLAIKVRNGFKSMMNGVIRAINSMIRGINKYSSKLGFTLSLMSEFEMETLKSVDAVDDKTEAIDDLTASVNAIPDTKTTDIKTTYSGGGGGSGKTPKLTDEQKAEEKAAKTKLKNEERSLENIRKLRQQFNVLNEEDKQKSELIALENSRENDLLRVEEHDLTQVEIEAINNKYDKKKEKLLAKHEKDNEKAADKVKTAWEESLADIQEGWNMLKKHIDTIMGAIGGLMDAQAEKQATILANQQVAEDEDYEKWYEREMNRINATIENEDEKNKAIEALDLIAATKREELDEAQDDASRELAKKAAIREKRMNIFNSLINTASAVVKALASAPPPANFILAGAVGIAGLAQTAAISSTPIPMAKGGIAFGPTNALVGEYAGARNNPEVVAPLDKLKDMLGGGGGDIRLRGQLKGNDIFLSNVKSRIDRMRFV